MSHFSVLTHVNKEDYEFDGVGEIMRPYSECTEEPEFLEFCDKTEEVQTAWKSMTFEAYEKPDGTFVHTFDRDLTDEQKKSFKFHSECPASKLYADIDTFADEYYGYSKYADERYGYFYNPNSFYDWYSTGGRFAGEFLVKCEDGDSRDPDAPIGYKWVSEALKSEICWDKMLELRKEEAKQSYETYQAILRTGDTSDNPFMKVDGDKVYYWGDVVAVKDEPFEAYCERCGCGEDVKYPTSCYGFVDEEGYRSRGDMGWFGMSSGDKPKDAWNNELQDLIESIPDDHMIILLDCHV